MKSPGGVFTTVTFEKNRRLIRCTVQALIISYNLQKYLELQILLRYLMVKIPTNITLEQRRLNFRRKVESIQSLFDELDHILEYFSLRKSVSRLRSNVTLYLKKTPN